MSLTNQRDVDLNLGVTLVIQSDPTWH